MTSILRVVDGKVQTQHHDQTRGELCWHCCHEFDDDPVPFPRDWDERRNTFSTIGSFCSFACVCGYNRDRGRLHNGKNCGMQIFQLYKQMTGKKMSPPIAPPRTFLKAFGGHMTIEEFRNASETVRYIELPTNCTVHRTSYLETPKVDGPKAIRNGVNQFVNATTRASEIRVPRGAHDDDARPVKRKKTMLELALGM